MAEIERRIDCIGVQLSKGAPRTQHPVEVTLTTGSNGERRVTCPYLPRESEICTAAALMNRTRCVQLESPSYGREHTEARREGLASLTGREITLLTHAASGISIQQSGEAIDRSRHTVIDQRKQIKKKLGATSTGQLELKALKGGVLAKDRLAEVLDFSTLRDLNPYYLAILQELVQTDQSTTNAAIGKTLFLSENTIKTQMKQIYQKVGIKDRVQLSIFYALAKELREAPSDETMRIITPYQPSTRKYY